MNTYQVIYEMAYPGADNDIRTAYVLAESFQEAEDKVVKRYQKECEGAYVIEIKKLENCDIIV